MDGQKRDEDRAGLVADVERLCESVSGVEMPEGGREAALVLLGDLRAVLARSETLAPRLGGLLDVQAHEEAPRPPRPLRGCGWRAGWR